MEEKKNTPSFIPEYFKAKSGSEFIQANPQKPPAPEVITRMQQRITRSKESIKASGSMNDGANSTRNQINEENQKSKLNEDEDNGNDNPIVALEPEANMKQGSAFLNSKERTSQHASMGNEEENPNSMSLYMQEKMYLRNKEQEKLLKAEEHHIVKTKDFNVYGRLRQEK